LAALLPHHLNGLLFVGIVVQLVTLSPLVLNPRIRNALRRVRLNLLKTGRKVVATTRINPTRPENLANLASGPRLLKWNMGNVSLTTLLTFGIIK
jgi:hypothetical protein